MGKTTPRFTGLLLGFMTEGYLGGVLLVWWTSSDAAGRAPFGPMVSRAMLIAAMVALALTMLVLAFGARSGKIVLRTCVIVASMAIAGLGALMIGSIFSDPEGSLILLAAAGIFGVWAVITLSRERVRRAG